MFLFPLALSKKNAPLLSFFPLICKANTFIGFRVLWLFIRTEAFTHVPSYSQGKCCLWHHPPPNHIFLWFPKSMTQRLENKAVGNGANSNKLLLNPHPPKFSNTSISMISAPKSCTQPPAKQSSFNFAPSICMENTNWFFLAQKKCPSINAPLGCRTDTCLQFCTCKLIGGMVYFSEYFDGVVMRRFYVLCTS